MRLSVLVRRLSEFNVNRKTKRFLNLKGYLGDSAASWMTLLCEGNLNNATNAGVFARNANNTSSNRNANIGSRSAAIWVFICSLK